MQMEADCIPCLLGRVLYQTNLCAPEKKADVMMEAVRVLSHRYRPGVNSATTATAVHRRAYDIIGCPDPYEDLKRRSNAVAESLLGGGNGIRGVG